MKEARNDIQLLYDFWVVAREGKLNVAANILDLTSSNLSKRISTLEGLMNQTLMIRDNKGIKLTLQGHSNVVFPSPMKHICKAVLILLYDRARYLNWNPFI